MHSVVTPDPKQLVRREFGPGAQPVRAARRMVRDALQDWALAELCEAVEHVTSELVANAIPEDKGTCVVTLSHDVSTSSVYLTVQDNRPGRPEVKPAPDDAEHGRGLIIVEALSDEWGFDANTVSARFAC